jgi:hypothetical protein
MADCAGQHIWLADSRRSPLAIKTTWLADTGLGSLITGIAYDDIFSPCLGMTAAAFEVVATLNRLTYIYLRSGRRF